LEDVDLKENLYLGAINEIKKINYATLTNSPTLFKKKKKKNYEVGSFSKKKFFFEGKRNKLKTINLVGEYEREINPRILADIARIIGERLKLKSVFFFFFFFFFFL